MVRSDSNRNLSLPIASYRWVRLRKWFWMSLYFDCQHYNHRYWNVIQKKNMILIYSAGLVVDWLGWVCIFVIDCCAQILIVIRFHLKLHQEIREPKIAKSRIRTISFIYLSVNFDESLPYKDSMSDSEQHKNQIAKLYCTIQIRFHKDGCRLIPNQFHDVYKAFSCFQCITSAFAYQRFNWIRLNR